jgi:hypothetical protein
LGLFDILKKKDSSIEPKVQSSLDDLPPIPHDQDPGLEVPAPTIPIPSTDADDIPPSPPGQAINPDVTPSKLPDLDHSLDAQPPTENDDDAPSPLNLDEFASVEGADLQSLNNEIPSASDDSSKPQPGESSDASPTDFTKEEPAIVDTTTSLEVTHDEPHNLPNFDTEPMEEVRPRMSITPEDEEKSSVRTESLLLKSIFVEKEHYVSLIAATKAMKEDLQSSGPQQRKLAHVDMKLAKEYGKFSTTLENFNENLMLIESILANEKW